MVITTEYTFILKRYNKFLFFLWLLLTQQFSANQDF